MPLSCCRQGSNTLPRSLCADPGLNCCNDLLVSVRSFIPSTIKSYNVAWSWFNLFCFSLSLPVFPILITTICTFIVHSLQSCNLNMSPIRKILVFSFMLDFTIQVCPVCSQRLQSIYSLCDCPSHRLFCRDWSSLSDQGFSLATSMFSRLFSLWNFMALCGPDNSLLQHNTFL